MNFCRRVPLLSSLTVSSTESLTPRLWCQPASQQGLGRLLQHGDEFVVDEFFVRALSVAAPSRRRLDQRPHNGLAADLENAVELGNRAWAWGCSNSMP